MKRLDLVILSAAKDLKRQDVMLRQILRCAQDDKGGLDEPILAPTPRATRRCPHQKEVPDA